MLDVTEKNVRLAGYFFTFRYSFPLIMYIYHVDHFYKDVEESHIFILSTAAPPFMFVELKLSQHL